MRTIKPSMPSFTLKNFQTLDRKSCRYIILLSHTHTLNKVHNSYKSQKPLCLKPSRWKNIPPLTMSALIARDCRIKPNMENNGGTQMSKWLNLFIHRSPKKTKIGPISVGKDVCLPRHHCLSTDNVAFVALGAHNRVVSRGVLNNQHWVVGGGGVVESVSTKSAT